MRKRNTPHEKLSDQLRRIIEAEGSCYDLAERAGVSRSVLSRFVRGERGLTTATLDRLAAVLRLRVVAGR
jgi:transcriptional regulator with XRE-family HTH domain